MIPQALLGGLAALIGLALPTAVMAQSYADEVMSDAPVAYYRFEESAGTAVADTSGNANHGTAAGGVQLGQQGRINLGRAARFDGIDGVVATPRTVGGNFTLELWINSSAASLTGSESYEGNGLLWSDVGGAGDDFVLALLNNQASFFTGNPDVSTTSGPSLVDGVWHHVVVTRTQGESNRIYVDGQLQGTGSTNANVLDANNQIMIGANTLDSRFFNGLIDEVAYYPAALSEARIAAHYAAATAVTTAIPVTSPLMLVTLMLGMLGLAFWIFRRRAAA